MNIKLNRTLALFGLALAVMACSFGGSLPAPSPSPTQIPTNTPPPTATNTPVPTDTLLPTATPDLAATQQAEAFVSLLTSFKDKGLLGTTDGTSKSLPDFTAEYAKKGFIRDLFDTGETLPDTFLLSAHFKWRSAASTPDQSGCGVAFGVQTNGDQYLVILDREVILFFLKRKDYYYRVGRTKGPAGPAFGAPADHDFALLVEYPMVYVSVDGAVTTYTLSMDQTSAGKLGFTVLAGTNSSYGTHCEITNVMLWTPK